MTQKRRVTATSGKTVPAGSAETVNYYPRVLGGQRLKDLALPKEVAARIHQHRIAEIAALIGPSNLAEVQARLKARKR